MGKSDVKLPLHSSDTENQRNFKGKGGVVDIRRSDDGVAAPFAPQGAKRAPRQDRCNGRGMLHTER